MCGPMVTAPRYIRAGASMTIQERLDAKVARANRASGCTTLYLHKVERSLVLRRTIPNRVRAFEDISPHMSKARMLDWMNGFNDGIDFTGLGFRDDD